MAAKKKHFTGPEMEALSGPLDAAQTALAVASFKIAARVANAAWKLIDTHDRPSHPLTQKLAKDELRDALHDYSPNVSASIPARRYAAQKLEELYAEAEQAPTREGVLEILYQAVAKEYE